MPKRCIRPKKVTHPSTNRAGRRVTLLMQPTTLPLRQTANQGWIQWSWRIWHSRMWTEMMQFGLVIWVFITDETKAIVNSTDCVPGTSFWWTKH